MDYTVIERWSRGASPLHRRDARAKAILLAVILVLIATARHALLASGAACLALLIAAVLWARLPLSGVLLRAAAVLPFSLAFAAVAVLSGEPDRAASLAGKSYISALAAVLLVATTPLPQLLRGLEDLGAPRFLLMVAQFVYRYTFTLAEQARSMRLAALSRGAAAGSRAGRRARFRAAAGSLAVLFARSYARAEAIHRAMISRGFQGHVPLLDNPPFSLHDGVFVVLTGVALIAFRMAIGYRLP